MQLSVVLPCFNEQEAIGRTVRSVAAWLSTRGGEHEIIVVNDGSRDGTGRVLQELRPVVPMLRIVMHECNRGYGVAVRSGCDAAHGEVIAFMDSDEQFCVNDLKRLLTHLDTVDFVAGRRTKRADSPIRNLYGKILGLFTFCVFGLWVRDVNCGMKVFRSSLWPRIRPVYGVEKLFNTELFLRMKHQGIPWIQVAVPHYPRRTGAATGATPRVILRMLREYWDLWCAELTTTAS